MEHQNEYDEISLRELIEALLRQKKLIALITAAAVALAGFYSFIIVKPTYEASMLLMTSNANTTNQSINGDNIDKMLDTLTQTPSMNVETYRQQILAPEVLKRTIDELGMGDLYTIRTLRDRISVETIKDTQMIRIIMISTDPEKASEIINRVGENFIEFVNENAKERAFASSKYIASQMEIEKGLYEEALMQQKVLLSTPRGSREISMELDAKLTQLTEYKVEKTNTEMRIEAIKASIKVAESIPSGGSSLTLNQATGRVLLDSSEKQLKMELAEVESQLMSLSDIIPRLERELEGLRVEYEDKYHQESVLGQKVQLAKETYEAFVKKYEEIRVAESAQVGEASVTVVSYAYPAKTPVGPNKTLNVAIGLVLGLMVGVFIAFFIEYWKSTGEERKDLGKVN
ncbi:Wzz/FepE/Etk N-terminal domain-containing protein [Gudongella oleilytica]|jgi:capsular polysaccharide biosynthesis protein|uniref:GumC family protein n=1 Tax=Gudongella oleilytica TaxID=1582259 RepID=UPI002A35B431|nr:Wzz/FepE/Etk N-terminal domain-containing protein [Gudongella oleilytica]MDY0255870.1 Wzz/FepE/Etk N-terminal domain-containing protein [Gudongella oleilytica]